MNERLVAYNLNIADPDESAGVTTSACMVMVPFACKLVYASISPFEDDAGAYMDIQDDGTTIVTGVDASDHDVPGEWASIHAGGANAAVAIAAGSEIEIDILDGAVANRFDVTLLFLTGETWG
jgi:hypothetical protein